MHRWPTATKENRRWKGHRSPHKERKTKQNKRNRIRQDPSTPSSSYSPTNLERLDANVSSRDGLRKPLLTSSRHKCLLPESSHDEEQREKKKKKKKTRGEPPQCAHSGPVGPPTQSLTTRTPSHPRFQVTTLYPTFLKVSCLKQITSDHEHLIWPPSRRYK